MLINLAYFMQFTATWRQNAFR